MKSIGCFPTGYDAFVRTLQAALQGHVDAQYNLGLMRLAAIPLCFVRDCGRSPAFAGEIF